MGSGNPDADSLPSEFTNFPQQFLNRTLGGVTCNATNTTDLCYLNIISSTRGVIWLQGAPSDSSEVIHFSGFDPEVTGTSTTTSSSSSETVSGSSSNSLLTLLEGNTIELGIKESINIKVGNTVHILKVAAKGKNYAKITIYSNPITKKIFVGKYADFDIDNDGLNDLRVFLESISNKTGKIKISYKVLRETPAPVREQEAPQKINKGVIPNEENKISDNQPEKETKSYSSLIYSILIIIIILIVLYMYNINKKSRHN